MSGLAARTFRSGAGEIRRLRVVGFIGDDLATRLGEDVAIDLRGDNAGFVVDVDDRGLLLADLLYRIFATAETSTSASGNVV